MKFTARSSRSTASRCRFLTARRSQHGHVSAPETLVDFHRSILTYHVLSGKVLSSDLEVGMEPKTLEGSTIEVTSLTPPTINDDSVIGPADVLATNGVIHVIDTVLMPGSDDEPTSHGGVGLRGPREPGGRCRGRGRLRALDHVHTRESPRSRKTLPFPLPRASYSDVNST